MFEAYVKLLSEIFTELRALIFSKETLEKSRLKPTYFTRNRKLTFPNLLLFLLAHLPGSLDSELRNYFDYLGHEKSPIKESAFSQSRNHMSEYAFKKMFEIVRDKFIEFEKTLPSFSRTMIYCGVDGSYLSLPNFSFLADFFGTYGKGVSSPTARVSLIFDSLNHFIYEAVLAPLAFNEKDLALETIKCLSRKIHLNQVIFILDRGYPSLNFFEELEKLSTHFIIRTKKNWYGLAELPVGHSLIRHFGDFPFLLRAVKLALTKSEDETLMTNLFEPAIEDFKDLYYLRWPIEIEYYFLKRVIRLEDFNGYTSNSIFQDFWISALLSNLASIFRMAADILVTERRIGSNNKYEYQVNMSEVISILHTRIIEILITENQEQRERCIIEVINEMAEFVTPIRRDRQKARRLSRNVFYHFNQKVH